MTSIKKLRKKVEKIRKHKNFLYSKYTDSIDRNNWNMKSIHYLIWFESRLEGLSNNRLYDNELNELVMDLIGFIKSNGFETNTEVKG